MLIEIELKKQGLEQKASVDKLLIVYRVVNQWVRGNVGLWELRHLFLGLEISYFCMGKFIVDS